MKLTAAPASEGSSFFANLRHKMPKDTGIFVVMLVIALTFEIAGWYVRDQSFLLNTNRLVLIVLQVAIIGIIAVGVTQVIITTGIDLSSGSVIALAAVVAASLAQTSDSLSPMFPALVNLPAVIPICAGIGVGLLCGLTNGFLVTRTGIPPFIATLGMMVSARGLAQYYTQGNPISFLSDSFTAIGQGAMPVIIFFVIAAVFHIALKHTRYGKYVYAIGGNMTSAKVSGINVNKYLVIVYTIAGALSGLAGVVLAARVSSGQSSMGMSYELDAIAAAVIGGSSLMGGVGRITGTLIGAMILGLIKSGFTFVGVDAYVQDIIKADIHALKQAWLAQIEVDGKRRDGVLTSIDNRIDARTGSVAVRAEFANPQHRLLPGGSVTILFRPQELPSRVMVPAAAVQQDPQGFFSWVLKPDHTAGQRRLTLAGQQGQQFAVEKGLQAGEQVITDGAQRLREGAAVQVLN
ncbi:TPA: efflux RND transporter periplasmic adaptor subunit [Klebsiella pneumoniae]